MEMKPQPEKSPQSTSDDSLDGVTPELLDEAPLMMTAEEIAKHLQISTRTVWRLKAKGDLPKSIKVGRAVRWQRSDILKWIQEGCPASDSLINNLIYTFILRPINLLIGRF